jgi:hypothetical protein
MPALLIFLQPLEQHAELRLVYVTRPKPAQALRLLALLMY